MLRIIAALSLLLTAAHAAPKVAVLVDGAPPAPAAHGIASLEQSLRARGFETVRQASGADFFVLAGIDPSLGPPEALTVRVIRHEGKPAVSLRGSDGRGLMYAALDAADRVSWGSGPNPFEHIRAVSEKPYLAERGISIYTMQRAYFESRLFDERHWQRYFDMLAADRINSFVVIFGYENGGFMAPLYPYFFDVPAYPDVQLVGIARERQERNTAAFKTMMRLAHERGIAVTAAIWDHIYRGGVQGGGIPGAGDNAGRRVPGLVSGVTTENLAGYTKAALKRFLEVFPEVDAIQFRMHEESGLKSREIEGFWHEVFGLIKAARPDMKLDLRAKGLPDSVIEDALNQGLQARVSTKYWMEQMGLPFHPTHTNVQNQRDRRHSFADLLRYPQRYRVHWQLWSGGTTRLLLWGDPEYVRRFAGTARLYDGNSFEVNEMLATKMLGEAHDAGPRAILNPRYRYYDYEFERYWHFYRLWGRLTYNPDTAPEVWEREFAVRFGPQAGPHVMKGLHAASKVLPRIVASSYRYGYFPTTRGWAEMQRQDDLARFAGEEGSDIQQFLNLRDEARSILDGTDTAMRRPEENSRWFERASAGILAEAALAEKAAGSRVSNEFRSTLTDLKILAGLARYHASRLRAGVAYNVYKLSGDVAGGASFSSRRASARLIGGAESGGAGSGGAESGGAESGGAESGGAESGGAESGGAERGGAESDGAESDGAESGGAGSPARAEARPTKPLAPPATVAAFDEAIAHEKRAVQAWSEIVEAAGDVYATDLAFGVHRVGFSRHWKEELQLLRADLEKLIAERQKAPERAQAAGRRTIEPGEPPAVKLQPAGTASPGTDLRISAKVTAPAGVKWVRLRYRHLTQYEDYQTAEMTPDANTGLYTASIPAAFIDPRWDLMYFVEAIDNKGMGRMYPDLDVETPYVVVPVRRGR